MPLKYHVGNDDRYHRDSQGGAKHRPVRRVLPDKGVYGGLEREVRRALDEGQGEQELVPCDQEKQNGDGSNA